MTNINNYKKLKQAKVITKELDVCINLLNTSIQQLTTYNKYIPIMRCLVELKNSRTILLKHLNKQQNILKENG